MRGGSGAKEALIEMDLATARSGGMMYRVETKIISEAKGYFERVTQNVYAVRGNGVVKEVGQASPHWEKLFVSAYGAGIRIKGISDFQSYFPVDAVYPLFKYDAPLQNPELIVRRIVDEAEKRNSKGKGKEVLRSLREMLSGILGLNGPEAVELSRTGLVLAGKWGKRELGELGDGYRSTVVWVLDLIAWWFLYDEEWYGQYPVSEIEGIVLVDEIEQHLHPKWQREFLSRLTLAFPKVQFVMTTHSPLCAAGSADLPRDSCIVRRLAYEEGASSIVPVEGLDGMRADQILTSDAFGLSDTRNKEMEELGAEYATLLGKAKLTKMEQRRMNSLKGALMTRAPDIAQTQRERELRSEVRALLEQLRAQS